MPELPEIETILRGIKPHIYQQTISAVEVRHTKLRWPVPAHLNKLLSGQVLRDLKRRNKYLLFEFDKGTLILHLGMSGRLVLLSHPPAPQKHDHVDIHFANHLSLRFTDPRRFGALLWTDENIDKHFLLAGIGPEPLTAAFNGDYLWKHSRKRKAAVKSFIMDGKIVAGVGNIYAAESLFQANIKPQKAAGKINRDDYQKLALAIKNVLTHAIKKGGTTLKDYLRHDGSPGYFYIELQVYGREGEPCTRCRATLKSVRIGQRSSVYCPRCQK